MPNDGVHSWYLQSLERGQKFQWKIQWILHKSSASWQRLVKSFPPRDKLYWRQKRALSLNLYNAVTITSFTLSQWSFKVLILLFNYLSTNPLAYFLQFCTKGLMTVLQFKPLFTQLEFTKKRRRFSTNTQLNLHFLKLKKNPFSILRPLKHQKTHKVHKQKICWGNCHCFHSKRRLATHYPFICLLLAMVSMLAIQIVKFSIAC